VSSRSDFAARSDKALLARFLEQLQHEGVRPTGRGLWFVSAAHDDEAVEATLAAAGRALDGM
jgi:glutamate-1-semialdehyde 2,1-aminomutase